MNDKIADRLDGMDVTGVGIRRESQNNSWMVLYPTHDEGPGQCLLTTASDLLAFCRAVVDRCDKPEHKHPERNVL